MSDRARRTAIRAGWIVAHDGRGHRLLRDGVVVIAGDTIVHVGPPVDGAVDETVDARDGILTPGLISTHAHLGSSPLDKSFAEDRGSPQFWYSGLFEYLPVRDGAQDEEGTRACIDFSMAELLRGGVTTVLDIGRHGEAVAERAGRFGLRVYEGLTFRSGRWLTRWTAIGSKIVERGTHATTAADVFDAATLGGALALGRDDLGRIAPRAKADLVLWKATSWGMTPLRDPVKNLVYNATAEDVNRVWVGGRLVVQGGRVLAADERAILADLQAAGERMWPRMKDHDWAGRGVDELSPLTYRAWDGAP